MTRPPFHSAHRPLAVLLLACTSAGFAYAATDLPKRKPGLWEIHSTMHTMGGHTSVIQNCIDERTDDLMSRQGEDSMRKQCSQANIRRDGNRITVDGVCRFEGSTATTHGVFTGDFNSAYKGELTTTYDPPMHGMKQSSMTLQARHLGPCQAGQKPGDIVMPGMGTFDAEAMMQKMPDLMKNMPNLDGLLKNLPGR